MERLAILRTRLYLLWKRLALLWKRLYSLKTRLVLLRKNPLRFGQISPLMQYQFELEMKERDYECDLQGIVNNANYQHYIEHTRHEFLLSRGVSFAELHQRGIDAVVARLNMAFKTPLRSGDRFVSRLAMRKEGIKYIFQQDIFRLADQKPVIRATVEAVCLVQGRLGTCPELDALLLDAADSSDNNGSMPAATPHPNA